MSVQSLSPRHWEFQRHTSVDERICLGYLVVGGLALDCSLIVPHGLVLKRSLWTPIFSSAKGPIYSGGVLQGIQEVLTHGKVTYKSSTGVTKAQGGYIVRLCLKEINFWREVLMMMALARWWWEVLHTKDQACKSRQKYSFLPAASLTITAPSFGVTVC